MRVTLHDCADEPIHSPGSIQPHGVLLVFDHVPRLIAHSENAALLPRTLAVPAIGEVAGPDVLGGVVAPAAMRLLELDGPRAEAVELRCDDAIYDLVMHTSDGLLMVEVERRPVEPIAVGPFGHLVHKVSARLQEQRELPALLDAAVQALRDLTLFDRVMAYRFLPDDSGEVVAEARRPDLEPFLGLRYPASDIPAQARRLYAKNRIRSIHDVDYTPVAIVPNPHDPRTGRPFDLSHCMLRSVSPIHIEYLRNMGVGASMSLSLLVGGKLWGLIACHHMAPHRPSYNVRLACLVLADTLSLLVAQAAELARFATLQNSAAARSQIIVRSHAADDLVRGIIEGQPGLLDVVGADGAAVTLGGRIATVGEVPPREIVRTLIAWLGTRSQPKPIAIETSSAWPDGTANRRDWAGLLAVEFFHDAQGYLIWFRREQIVPVRWGAPTGKVYGQGPNGPRLTPLGSYTEWRELARGSCEPWSAGERDAAQDLREQLQQVALQKTSQLERVHSLLIGVLGHDLRTPLHAISMSAAVLEGYSQGIGKTILRSTSRMSALIDSMLDFAQLQNRNRLSVTRQPHDLHKTVSSIVDETTAAFPGCTVRFVARGDPLASIDRTRIGQLVSNLLSNARHHGDPTREVEVRVQGDDDVVCIEVSNHGEPIPDEMMSEIFEAFRSRTANKNSGRVGLGLFICRAIASAHDGTIDARCADGITTFRVQISRRGGGEGEPGR